MKTELIAKTAFMVLSTIGLIACNSWAAYRPVTLNKEGGTPVEDVGRRTIQTGDFAVWSWPANRRDTATLLAPVSFDGTTGKHNFRVKLLPGKCIFEGADNSDAQYLKCSPGAEFKYEKWENTPIVVAGVMLEKDKNLPARVYFSRPNDPATRYSIGGVSPEISERSNIVVPSAFPVIGFVQTLTYTGLANNQIRFSYREFKDNLIRDSFSQDLSFDYEPGQEYGYKGARFTVHKATSLELDLTLIKSFD